MIDPVSKVFIAIQLGCEVMLLLVVIVCIIKMFAVPASPIHGDDSTELVPDSEVERVEEGEATFVDVAIQEDQVSGYAQAIRTADGRLVPAMYEKGNIRVYGRNGGLITRAQWDKAVRNTR